MKSYIIQLLTSVTRAAITCCF